MTSDTDLVVSDARDALAVALRLAFGRPRPEDAQADWALVLDAASRELLAALAWNRSGLFIRRHAGSALTTTWRRAAIAAEVRGERQLELLREATVALASAGVDTAVLKGMPLGKQLYGDPFLRCSADIDLYVPATQRSRAAAVLRSLGWRSIDGCAPWHETWSITGRAAEPPIQHVHQHRGRDSNENERGEVNHRVRGDVRDQPAPAEAAAQQIEQRRTENGWREEGTPGNRIDHEEPKGDGGRANDARNGPFPHGVMTLHVTSWM